MLHLYVKYISRIIFVKLKLQRTFLNILHISAVKITLLKNAQS